MRDSRFIKALIYILASLTLTLTSCGGEGVGTPSRNTGVGQARQVSGADGRTVVLRTISITPSNPLWINAGKQLQFAATGSYSDNYVQDLTTLVVWTSSDSSIATISNAPDSKGLVIAVSRGYCSITATLDGILGSTIIGIK
ncbi:MAG TPA: Ig-like domain-containing protein [Nitrospirota bacterium]|nr:Ig-like domain-containing protein [Nitrospirota bacterium]